MNNMTNIVYMVIVNYNGSQIMYFYRQNLQLNFHEKREVKIAFNIYFFKKRALYINHNQLQIGKCPRI